MNKCKICELKSSTRNGKCDKCYIKYANNKVWIPFNENSWNSYDDFKNWHYNSLKAYKGFARIMIERN